MGRRFEEWKEVCEDSLGLVATPPLLFWWSITPYRPGNGSVYGEGIRYRVQNDPRMRAVAFIGGLVGTPLAIVAAAVRVPVSGVVHGGLAVSDSYYDARVPERDLRKDTSIKTFKEAKEGALVITEEKLLAHLRKSRLTRGYLSPYLKITQCSSDGSRLREILNLIREYGYSKYIRGLFLSKNYLKRLPEGLLEGFNQLQYLDLTDNRLSVLDEKVFQGLDDLTVLSLKDNLLKAFPKEAGNYLPRLNNLDLADNLLPGFPADFAAFFPNLNFFNLSGNELLEAPPFPCRCVANFRLNANTGVIDAIDSPNPLDSDVRGLSSQGIYLDLRNMVMKRLRYSDFAALERTIDIDKKCEWRKHLIFKAPCYDMRMLAEYYQESVGQKGVGYQSEEAPAFVPAYREHVLSATVFELEEEFSSSISSDQEIGTDNRLSERQRLL